MSSATTSADSASNDIYCEISIVTLIPTLSTDSVAALKKLILFYSPNKKIERCEKDYLRQSIDGKWIYISSVPYFYALLQSSALGNDILKYFDRPTIVPLLRNFTFRIEHFVSFLVILHNHLSSVKVTYTDMLTKVNSSPGLTRSHLPPLPGIQPSFSQPATNQLGQPASNQLGQPASNQPASNQPTTNQPSTNQLGQPAFVGGGSFGRLGYPVADGSFGQSATGRLGHPAFSQPSTNQLGQPLTYQLGQPSTNQLGHPVTSQPATTQPTFAQPLFGQSSYEQSPYEQSLSSLLRLGKMPGASFPALSRPAPYRGCLI